MSGKPPVPKRFRRRDPDKTKCPSRKIRYRDHAAASEALESARMAGKTGSDRRSESRVYQCTIPECHGGWHLTSLESWNDEAVD